MADQIIVRIDGQLNEDAKMQKTGGPRDQRNEASVTRASCFKQRLRSRIHQTVQTALSIRPSLPEVEQRLGASESLPLRVQKTLRQFVKEELARVLQGGPRNHVPPPQATNSGERSPRDAELTRADERIGRLFEKAASPRASFHQDTGDEDARQDGQKYMSPKYHNVETLLRYVEADNGQAPLRLVIMNFND